MLGDHIGHYKILEKIGEGGMGVVYRALDTRLEREVALKFLSVDFTGSEELKKRFYEEAKAASALDHPNICTIHAIDETDDGRLFIAMGYYQGETVKAKLRRGPLPWEEIVDLGLQIASGLQAAHERGIIHLDIKPANLMVTPDGIVKILDFGLSRFTSEIDRTRPQGPLMGTVAYMSPELVQNEETGPESDIWALGVVMWEMATGVRPFQGKNDMAVLYSIVHKDCGSPGEKDNELPPELVKAIRRMLVKDRGQRYQTSAEVVADLEPLHQSSQVLSGELPWVSRQDWQRQKRIQLVIGTIAAVVLSALLTIILIPDRPPPPTPEVLLVFFEDPVQETAPEEEWLGMAFADLLIHRLSGAKSRRWIFPEDLVLPQDSPLPIPEKLGSDFDAEEGFRETIRDAIRQSTTVDWVVGLRHRTETGQRITVSPVLQNLESGEVIVFEEEEGQVAELWEMAAKVAKDLGPPLELEVAGSSPGATEEPTDPKALKQLAEARGKLRRMEFKEALSDLDEAISRNPESPVLHLSLAEAYSGLYRDNDALKAVEAALMEARRLPEREQVYYLAWHRELWGDLNRAAALFRVWWIAEDPLGRSEQPEVVDRGLHVALLFARLAQKSETVATVVDRLRPLAAADPRLPLVECLAVRDEHYDRQQAAAAQVVELARQADAPLLEARGLTLEGLAWRALGDLENAAEKLEAARDIYVRKGYKGAEAGVLLDLGHVKKLQQDFLEAKVDFDRAARLYNDIGNDALWFRVLNNKAVMVADNEGELRTAIGTLEGALPKLEEKEMRDALVAGLINMCDWQAARGQLQEADEAIQKAFEVLRGWRNTGYRARALILFGRLLTLQGELQQASIQLNEAIDLFEEAGDGLWADYTRSFLAQTRFYQGNFEEALELEARALATYENGDTAQYAIILAERGRLRMTRGELTEAAEDFRRALDKSRTLSNPEPTARIRLYKAQLFFAENRIDDAVEEARGALGIAADSDFLLLAAETYLTLSRSLLARKDLEEATREFEKARELLTGIESPIYQLPLMALEARILTARGKPEALDLLRSLAVLRDLPGLELEIRLAQEEIRSGNEDSRRNKLLATLAKEADHKGYGLIALLARRAMGENTDTSP